MIARTGAAMGLRLTRSPGQSGEDAAMAELL